MHFVVNLHERTWWNEGIHGVVSKADVTRETVPDVHVADNRDGHLTPDFYHVREQSRLLHSKPFVEAHGESGGSVFIVDFQLCRVRFRQTNL